MSNLQRRISEMNRRTIEESAPPPLDAPVAAVAPVQEAPSIPKPEIPVTIEKAAPGTYQIPAKKRTSAKMAQLRKQIRSKLLTTPDEADSWRRGEIDKETVLVGRLKALLQKGNMELSPADFNELKEGLLNDLMGFGAIEPLVQDKAISEIMVTGADMIFAEQKGKMAESNIVFDDEDHIMWTATFSSTARRSKPVQAILTQAAER